MRVKGLSSFQLKIVAIIAMLCDHFAWGFLEFHTVPAQLLHIIGRLTIPIMCFFIAEGYRKTSDLKKYILRMILFWIISIVPFYLFFHDIYDYRQNIIFDLLLGLLLLTVLNSSRLSVAQKIIFTVLLFLISGFIGGWPVLPLLYILIFFYKQQAPARFKWFCCTTVVFVCLLTAAIWLNSQYHFAPYDWLWYDRLYLLGFLLAAPLLLCYNGQKGIYPLGRYFFYVFYPLHFCFLYVLQIANLSFGIYSYYLCFHLLVTALVIAVGTMIILSRPSRAHTASIIFASFALVYMFGFLLEITTTSIPVICAAIKLEYFGECILLIGFTWFIAEFCGKVLPKFVYALEGVFSVFVLSCVFTIEQNTLFYRSIRLDISGAFPRIDLDYGVVFYIFAIYMTIICIYAWSTGISSARHHNGIERKRIYCMMCSCACPWVTTLARSAGLTGGYEITPVGVLGTVIFIAIALIKYGYFDSIQLSGANGLHNGKEGILIINSNHRIVYFNQRIRALFPDLRLHFDAYQITHLKDIFECTLTKLTLHNKTYEMRVEPLIEAGYRQGFILWAIDMTDYYNQLKQAESCANIDALTGLHNRKYFRSCFQEHLHLDGRGAMMMLDLDNFKRVNDTYGHGIGDTTLLSLSETIKKIAGTHNLCCRMGGDEFCLFFKNIVEQEQLTDLARQLIYVFKHSLDKAGIANITSVSIGIAILDNAVLEEENEPFDELYRRADRALYTAKNEGKDVYRFYA